MEIRRYTNIQAFNQLYMSEFRMDRIEYDTNGSFQNVIFLAGSGYMEHFRAEIKFIEVEYIATPKYLLF